MTSTTIVQDQLLLSSLVGPRRVCGLISRVESAWNRGRFEHSLNEWSAMSKLIKIAGGLAFAAVALAIPANADSTDQEFLNDLTRHGLWYSDALYTINYAHGSWPSSKGVHR